MDEGRWDTGPTPDAGDGTETPRAPGASAVALAELKATIAAAEREAREYGIDPNRPEGRLLQAVLAATAALGRIVRATDEGMRRAAEVERDRAAALVKALETAVAQARIATVNLEVEKEILLRRIMGETLPGFAKALQAALVIREEGWREELQRRWVLGAVLLALVLFGGGYGLRAWQDWEATAGLRACIERPYTAGGRMWCELPVRAGAAPAAEAQPSPGPAGR